MLSYEERSASFNFTAKEEIKAMINRSESGSELVFLDVRGASEIAAASLETPGQFSIVYMPCSRDDATKLVEKSGELIPDKNSKSFLNS